MGEVINQTFYYDGKTLTVDLPDQRYYATSPAPPTIDAMLDFARDKLDIIAPGSDLIYKDAFACCEGSDLGVRGRQGCRRWCPVRPPRVSQCRGGLAGMDPGRSEAASAEICRDIEAGARIAAVRRGAVKVGCRAQYHRCHLRCVPPKGSRRIDFLRACRRRCGEESGKRQGHDRGDHHEPVHTSKARHSSPCALRKYLAIDDCSRAETPTGKLGCRDLAIRSDRLCVLPSISGSVDFPVASGGARIMSTPTRSSAASTSRSWGRSKHTDGRWGVFTDVLYLDVGGSKSNTRDFALRRSRTSGKYDRKTRSSTSRASSGRSPASIG